MPDLFVLLKPVYRSGTLQRRVASLLFRHAVLCVNPAWPQCVARLEKYPTAFRTVLKRHVQSVEMKDEATNKNKNHVVLV